METPSTLIKPRLRLFRRSPSPSDATPQPGPSSARPLVDDDDVPTPRIHPKLIANADPTPRPVASATSAPAETPAARLRALLAREPRSPRSTTPPPSETDSVARFGSSTSSVTRGSLKDIFSRALREPGDTPQKGRPRRNSFDGSSMETTPVVDKNRGQRRLSRRSLSDEEAENPRSSRRSDPSFRLSTAVTFDHLRSRLVSSQSQLMDQNLQEALYDQPSLASTSTSRSQHPPQASTSSSQPHTVRKTLPVTSFTPLPSFQMSSQTAFQSNLLDQDSEMQRAMGDVLNSESEASAPALNGAQSPITPSDSRPSSVLSGRKNSSRLETRRTSYVPEPSTTTSPTSGKDKEHHPQEEHGHRREREWNRPRLSLGSSTPETHRRHSQELHRRLSQDFRSHSHTKTLSHESVMSRSGTPGPVRRSLERRGSLASLRSFDDDHSSRPSSVGSQADYRDRNSELEQEKNYEREREWNKRQPPSRPSSSLSTSSNHSFSHSHSHPPRSPSAVPYLTPTHASLQRKSSRTSLRSDSPASLASSLDSLKEREQEEKKEVTQERERNWNSPRPQWSITKSPSSSHLRVRNKDGNTLRATSSLTRLGDSSGHKDNSRLSARSDDAPPNVDTSSATLPAPPHKLGDHLDSGVSENVSGPSQSSPFNGSSPSKTPGAASRFGWNFARSPLPPLELDDPADRPKSTSSPTPGSRPFTRTSEAVASTQIPVRSRMKNFSSVGYATSDMSFTHVVGDESSFQQDDQNGSTEVIEPHGREGPSASKTSRGQGDVVLVSDEEPISDFLPRSTTPKSNPPRPIPGEAETDTETEVLTSPSPQGSPQLKSRAVPPDEASDPQRSQTPDIVLGEPPISATPPGTPPPTSSRSQPPTPGTSPSVSLVTPLRQISFTNSTLDFRTPSPPQDLPDLPGPPSSSDDDALGSTPIKDRRLGINSNFTLSKTPKPPGAWAATPLPPKISHRPSSPATLFPLESTPPAFTSTPLPRANTYPHPRAETLTNNAGENGLLTPVGTLSRAKSLPMRTPAPPGAWMATPGQSALLSNGVDQSQYGSLGRKKGPLKVRFDVTESETSATEGHPNSPLSAIRLVNPELPSPQPTTDNGANSTEVGVHENSQPTPHRRTTSESPATPISQANGPSPRSLRKSPAVRLVDAYGRERGDEEANPNPLADLPNGHVDGKKMTSTPPTPRRSLVRIVDAMGREVDTVDMPDAPEDRTNKSFEADLSVVSDDSSAGHAETLTRMRKTLKDLAESLSDADRSEDLELNSGHLEQLEEVSQAARLVRNQLAHNLQLETAKHDDLQRNRKSSIRTRGLLLTTTKRWSPIIIYCGVIVQLLLVLAMWRYAHSEAHRLFYTTYYDPLYPEFTPIQGISCFSGAPPTSRPWTLIDSYETIQREGWSAIRKEILRAMRHAGDQAWERWGEHAHFEKPT